MNKFEKFCSVPFKANGREYNGCDCWGLVRLVYRDLRNIELPGYLMTEATDARAVARQMRIERHKWRQVEKPKQFDVVLMKAMHGKLMIPWHVGVMIDDTQLMHIQDCDVHPVVQRITDPSIKYRILEYRRYAG